MNDIYILYIYMHESNQIFMSGSPTQASHLWRIVLTFTVYPLYQTVPNGVQGKSWRIFFLKKFTWKSPSMVILTCWVRHHHQTAKVRLCHPARSWRRSSEGRERISHGQERVLLGGSRWCFACRPKAGWPVSVGP